MMYSHYFYRKITRRTTAATAVFFIVAFCIAATVPTYSQERYEAKVNVDTDRLRNIMAFRALGVRSTLWDSGLTTPETAQLLRAVGVTTIHYPGMFADRYHWSTHKATPAHGSDPTKPEYFAPATGFGQFAQMLDRLGGTAVITVNYGTNLTGTGPGEPAEAAAWVAYANGDPADSKVIGKDSTGYDWKTVGYWAGMRAAAPLASDDGFNFLRISHPQPLKIKHWEIGNEVYSNGYYAKDGKNDTEEDLHAPYDKSRSHNAKLSPAAYGNAVLDFAKAMKAVDPTIKIGVSLLTPPVKGSFTQAGAKIEHWDGVAPGDTRRLAGGGGGWLTGVSGGGLTADNSSDWNPGVMKVCGKAVDFASIHWQFGKFMPPDWKMLDVPATLSAPYSDMPEIVKGLVEVLTKYGATKEHNIQLAVTGLAAWGTEKDPLVESLFLAESYMSLIETGSITTVGVEAHGNGFLDSSNKPGPLAYGLGMIHVVAKPNDTIVQSESSNDLLSVHAVKRADGSLALMLLNKDTAKPANVRISLKGAKVGAKAIRFDFGKNTNGLPVKGAADAGDTFTIEVPPLTITDLVIPKAS